MNDTQIGIKASMNCSGLFFHIWTRIGARGWQGIEQIPYFLTAQENLSGALSY